MDDCSDSGMKIWIGEVWGWLKLHHRCDNNGQSQRHNPIQRAYPPFSVQISVSELLGKSLVVKSSQISRP